MTARRALLLASVLIATFALLPAAGATADPSVKTCGYHKGAEECASFCILGVWVSKDGGATHEEVCVVPNCACYIGLVQALPRFF